MKASPHRPALPEGWRYPRDAGEAAHLHAELQRELPPGHVLFGCVVEAFARRDGHDDVLFRWREPPGRFTVVHLTWRGEREVDARWPAVEYEGSLAGFIDWEARVCGFAPPDA
jgi:hypothetical protein